jgi:hypothetical protein
MLVLHDTTEFCFRREDGRDIGYLTNSTGRSVSRPQSHKVCGMLMHSSLAVTTEGLPLGIAAIKFWTRDKFKGTNRLKNHINPTRVPIEEKESIRWLRNLTQSTELLGEPTRCVHIGDREADIRTILDGSQGRHSFPISYLCGSLRRGWKLPGRRSNAGNSLQRLTSSQRSG